MTEGEFRFGAVRVLARRREIWRDGVPLKVSSRGFDLLLALLERPGELLTRRELIARVWNGRVVEDANLAVQVSHLRQRLGADGAAIRTEPGRGFRFVGELQPRATAPPVVETPSPTAASSIWPTPPDALIGRETLLAALEADVAAGRLLTLCGPAGVGKTRLAIELGRGCRARFADGALLLDLVPLAGLDAIVTAFAERLGAQVDATVDAIARHLRDRVLLVLLDNCEHVIDAAARLVAACIPLCPRVAWLATSREPLRVDGERVAVVPPLQLAPDAAIERGQALDFAATRLFVERVRALDPAFDPSPADAATISLVCRRLDGMPLAIELATGRVPGLGLTQLEARLHDGLKLLAVGSRAAPARHRTLRATLEWSHALLTSAEQRLFRRLAVFAHRFTLPLAEAVVASPDLADWDIVDGVDSLVTKSMLVAAEDEDGLRYHLLETTKAYALERLIESGERDRLCRRLAQEMVTACRAAEASYRTIDRVAWVRRHMRALPDLRASLAWAFGPDGDAELGIEVIGLSWPIWRECALLEGRQWLAKAEGVVSQSTPREVRAMFFAARGWLWPNVRNPEAAAAFRQAAALLRELGDALRLGEVLRGLGQALALTGKPEEALPVLREARALLETAGVPSALACCIEALGQAAYIAGRYDASRAHFEQALELFRAIGAYGQTAPVLINLGDLACNAGDVDAAIEYTVAAIDCLHRYPLRGSHLAVSLGNLTGLYLRAGRVDDALRTACDALPLVDEAGMAFWFYDHLAALAAELGADENAALLLGHADASYTSQNDYRQPTEQHAYAHAMQLLRERMPARQLQRLLRAGRAMSAAQAHAKARQWLAAATVVAQLRVQPAPVAGAAPDRLGARTQGSN